MKHRRYSPLFNSSETHITEPQIQSCVWLNRCDVTTDHIYITATYWKKKNVFREHATFVCFPNCTRRVLFKTTYVLSDIFER